MLKAIIFDMDGVITDTEYLDFSLQSAFIKTLNPACDEQELFRLVGKSYGALFRTMQELAGGDLPIEEIRTRYREFVGDKYDRINYREYFRSDMQAVLEYAKENHMKLAVASSSTREHIVQILDQCGITDCFDSLLSGEELKESKPNPEIYVRTLERLGVRADEAVAIEDSPGGIAAAKAAGIPVIAYVETRMKIDQSAADYCGCDMLEILAVIRRLAEEKAGKS